MLIISFPRSGQHLLERLLNFIYLYYNKNYSYCEFYNCCKTLPCKKKCIFQKNHDFHLTLGMPSDNKFIVLYRRDKIRQLEAYFRFNYLNSDKHVKINYENSKLFNELIQFIKQRSKYYDEFIQKYVTSKWYTNSLIIEYGDFMNEPKKYIKNLIEYLNLKDNDINLDEDVDYIFNNFEKIEYKNSLSDSIYNKIVSML